MFRNDILHQCFDAFWKAISLYKQAIGQYNMENNAGSKQLLLVLLNEKEKFYVLNLFSYIKLYKS